MKRDELNSSINRPVGLFDNSTNNSTRNILKKVLKKKEKNPLYDCLD